MCGLVGIAGDITYEARSKVFRDLLDVCQTRGRDSTGIIKVDKKLDYDWIKQVGPPSILCDSRMYDNRVERAESSVLIGHCRAKTVGEASVKNAHPFDYPEEGICGVHNGTLRGYHSLDTHAYGKVDSEILYGHLAKNGVDETFPVLEGAYACVWWDNNAKTINFIRNNERPLWFTWSEDKKMMFWASEPWMFGAVARKIKLWDGGEEKKVYVELPIHTLWSFRVNPQAKGDEPFVVMAPAREVKPKPRPTYTGGVYNNNRSAWEKNWERVGNGQYVRRDSPASNKENSENKQEQPKGGEVTDPFKAAREKGFIDPTWSDSLEDKLPDEFPFTEKQNTPLSNVDFLKHSVTHSASSTGRTPTTRSKRPILSLAGGTSLNSPTKSNGALSGGCGGSSTNTHVQMPRGVSLREIVGQRYITDNATSTEWSAEEFLENTGGQCSFCTEHIMALDEVALILNKTQFVCKSCLEEPKETTRLFA